MMGSRTDQAYAHVNVHRGWLPHFFLHCHACCHFVGSYSCIRTASVALDFGLLPNKGYLSVFDEVGSVTLFLFPLTNPAVVAHVLAFCRVTSIPSRETSRLARH